MHRALSQLQLGCQGEVCTDEKLTTVCLHEPKEEGHRVTRKTGIPVKVKQKECLGWLDLKVG